MSMLVIYDATGKIISGPMQGDVREPVGIPFMWVEIPQGKGLVSIDTATEEHRPIFEDIPKSEHVIKFQKIDEELDNIVNTIVMLSMPTI